MTQDSIQPFLDWISAHPTSSGAIVFLISLSESLAVVGLLVPGVVMMTAIGGMMGAGILPFWGTLIWAILGAIAGDGISYWLGYHYHQRLRQFWPFKQFPKLMQRGETFFRSHGGKSIVIGRFAGPVRPMIPVIAGMMDMEPKRFILFNVLSAIAWAPLYSLPGILIGASLGSLSPEVASRAGLLVLLLLFAIWFVYEILFFIGAWILDTARRILKNIFLILDRLPWINPLLRTAQGSEEGQLGLIILFILSISTFLIISDDVTNITGIAEWNEPVYQALRALYADKWIQHAALFSGIGDPIVLLPVAFMVAFSLIRQKKYNAAFCWVLVVGLGTLAGFIVKFYMEIPRPEGLIHYNHEFAYPSAHTLISTLIFGFTALIARRSLTPKLQWFLFMAVALLILGISFSRLYLGLHWFTDILGSLSLGIAFITVGGFLYRRLEKRPIPATSLLITSLLTFMLTFSLYTIFYYPQICEQLVRQWPVQTMNEKEWWHGEGDIEGLYRTGALKKQATTFDIQWLGDLAMIEKDLKENGWEPIPRFSLKTSVQLLASIPSPLHFPVMPKFHRDRLPVITVAKAIQHNQRLVLQIWHSDYLTENQTSLWVGTLRLEIPTHPLPLITLYLESPMNNNLLKHLEKALLEDQYFQGRFVKTPIRTSPIFLIKPGK